MWATVKVDCVALMRALKKRQAQAFQIPDSIRNEVLQMHPARTRDLARAVQQITYPFKLFSANVAWILSAHFEGYLNLLQNANIRARFNFGVDMQFVPRFMSWAVCATLIGGSSAGVAAPIGAGASSPLPIGAGATPTTMPLTPILRQDINKFLAAPAGYRRVVIGLSPLKQGTDENNVRVELMVGKTLRVNCNEHWFVGDLEKKAVPGEDYSYYQLTKANGPASTRRGCLDQSERTEFVSVRGAGYMVPYNSQLPLVAYVPDTFEVSYRLWLATEKITVPTPLQHSERNPFVAQ